VKFWKEHFDLEFPQSGFFRLIDQEVLLALLDKRVQIDESGKWKLKEDWLSTTTNFRFTFRVVSQMYGIDLGDPFSGAEWQAFGRCVATRNRVTHPKVLQEFQILDAEIADLQTALQWFIDVTTGLGRGVVSATEWDEERVERFLEQVPPDARPEFVERLMEIFEFNPADFDAPSQ
jgi:hypothetical protein